MKRESVSKSLLNQLSGTGPHNMDYPAKDEPNHLGLRCNTLPEPQMALITSSWVPQGLGPGCLCGTGPGGGGETLALLPPGIGPPGGHAAGSPTAGTAPAARAPGVCVCSAPLHL